MKHKLWIIKAGGEILDASKTRTKILRDVVKHHKTHRIVFVHGGGPQIERGLLKNRIPVKFVGGRRFTSKAGLSVVEKYLSGVINQSLARQLNAMGAPAFGLSGRDANIITGKAVPGLGRAAKPKTVRPQILTALLDAGLLPVLSPVSADKKGAALNINADDAASAVAAAMKADNLVFLTDVPGVLDLKGKRFPKLTSKQIQSLIEKGIIKGGMIPKVQSAQHALRRGVREVDIVNGKKGITLSSGTRILK